MSRLDEIKRESRQMGKMSDPPIFYREVHENDFEWLIEQAEQNQKYRKMIKDMSNEIEISTDVMSNADNADELNEEVIWLKGVRGYCVHCNGKGFNGLDYCPQCTQGG